MATILSDDCCVTSIQCFVGGEHWTCSVPYGPDAHVDPIAATEDLVDFIENDLIAKFQDVMAADNEVLGYNLEGMAGGSVIPVHVNVPQGTYIGTVAGASAPPNVSMLLSFYNSEQATSGARVRVAKSFVGPPPLSKVVNQTLDAAFVSGPLNTLAVTMRGSFVGVSSGTRWRRMLSRNPNSGVQLYQASTAQARGTVFTQKRRLLPMF